MPDWPLKPIVAKINVKCIANLIGSLDCSLDSKTTFVISEAFLHTTVEMLDHFFPRKLDFCKSCKRVLQLMMNFITVCYNLVVLESQVSYLQKIFN